MTFYATVHINKINTHRLQCTKVCAFQNTVLKKIQLSKSFGANNYFNKKKKKIWRNNLELEILERKYSSKY